MTEINTIEKGSAGDIRSNQGLTTEARISFCHLALFIIFLPFDRIYSELVLISFLLHTIIHLSRERVNKIFTRQTMILSSVFLLNLLCLAWSPDKKEGVNCILRQLAVIIFPISFAAAGIDIRKAGKPLLLICGFTCTATILYLYADALHIIIYNKLPLRSLLTQAFINHNFSAPIGLHATYLSMYTALAAAAFLHFLLAEQRKRWRLIYILSLAVLFAGLVQLSSRAALFSFLLITAVVFPVFIPAGKKRTLFILVSLACSLVVLGGIIRSGALKKRYIAELRNDLAQKSINNDLIESRMTRWKAAMPLIRQSLLTGHGTGSEKKLLQEKYFESKLYNSYLNELNTHNQYLKFLLETGIPGLFVFLFTLLWGLLAAWRNRDVVFMSFMVIIMTVSFSENILDVNKGIFFYGFFFSFFEAGSKPIGGFLRYGRKDQKKE